MKNKKISIKSALLKLFNEGKNEAKALEEISKTHSSCNISEKTVNAWYGKFKAKNQDLDDINNNPDLSTNELAKFAGVSRLTIYKRIKELNGDERLNYKIKHYFKHTDEFYIDLVNKNPKLDMRELAGVAGVSRVTMYNKIKELNGDERLNYKFKDNLKFSDEFLIDLINKNPKLSIEGLAKLAGTSKWAISSRIKQINSKGIRVNYVKKKHIPDGYNTSNLKLTYEFLDGLINSNPDLTMDELAVLAGVSSSTIQRKIKKFNKAGKTLNYCKKDIKKYTDEFLIDLINKNPELSLEKLANIAGVTPNTIFNRIKQLNDDERLNYELKDNSKFSDEFLADLINNSDLSIEKLSNISGISPTAISQRIKQINRNEEKVKYRKKSPPKLTDEYITDLVNENPELTIDELAELAGVSASTISTRIKRINSNEEKIKYRKKSPPKLTDEYITDLVNENPELNMEELAELAGVSATTISTRINRINSNEEKVKYRKKSLRKLTDEYITNLVNENPELNMEELAELAGVSVTTISTRIKRINSNGVVANYTKKNKR
ncbi:hypothetical protein CONCODRAFT_143161 [Conidiobolus coronatus NRRL 28638]|uniref:Mos1 transposase HTH domain-containing protein n=1 Tax=Conidiobolus coronatus (strain ATCC 28846 / CBS 209.66 / NRRL 28638) TaxID=796925 RepID=A0A137PA50_CONC2|nr:hypothetical protein CONCODRAFT_143161 [Conidiobolus coronatus NRRL 28638]|eukprot:KXN71883.1 hypothetical protein CONCODRAFT_143161 [Conidiobolus coronatus NRRL 28638]